MKRIIAVLAIAALVGALHVDVALAARRATRLTMTIADRNVGTGETIHVRGRLRSTRASCERNKPIMLEIAGAPYDTVQTNDDGTFHFAVRGPHPLGSHKFQTFFVGTRRCKPSAGPSLTVTVGG